MILAGDIGGTKTWLALFNDVKKREIVKHAKFSSQKYPSLEEIIQEFLQDEKIVPSHACFGVAGPVNNNISKVTNLPWTIDAEKIQTSLKIPRVFLINDLEANAWGIRCLKEDELYVISEGKEGMQGNQGLISAGTGLGEAGLYYNGKEHIPFASEGGHCNFAPVDEEEIEIFRYFHKMYGHVSYERLLCGKGLINLYNFYLEVKKERELPELKEKMKGDDPAKLIHEYAISKQCNACVLATNKFLSIYGAETGNVALKFLTLGGMYIGGGIAPKMIEMIKEGQFFRSFIDKGRFDKLLSTVRLQVILNPHTALLGAGSYVEHHI
jgi:glucokinase